MTVVRDETDPALLTATAARELLRRRALGALELVDACIDRIERLDPIVNAVVVRRFDVARAEARAIDARAGRADAGALGGLPILIKDIQDVAGSPTTWGSPDRAVFPAGQDSGIVARVRAAGAIVLGKTNVPELSIGANTINPLFGATGNPFAPDLTCGGSSGGSAAALAAGFAPLATGSDHGGSLRIPASFCGVVGLRATPGVVPNEQRKVAQSYYAVQGPMARSVADTGLLLSVIAGRDHGGSRDPMAFPLDAGAFASVPVRRADTLRLAFSPDLGGVTVSHEVRKRFAGCVDALRAIVAETRPARIDLTQAPDVDWHLRQYLFAANYAEEAAHWRADINPNVRATFDAALRTPLLDIARARRAQQALLLDVAAQLEDVDALLLPGVSIAPFPWRHLNPAEIDGVAVTNYMGWLELTAALTVVGHPVVALPIGQDENGLPFGVQLVGRLYGERALLGVAAALEAAIAAVPELAPPRVDAQWLAAQNVDCQGEGKRVLAAD